MAQLTRIATPPWKRWQAFRTRIAPFVILALAGGAGALMWRQNLAAPTLLGEVESIQSNLSSPKAGKIAGLTVSRLQSVKAGDVVGQIITTDPEVLQASLAVIQAEVQLLRVNLQPMMGQQRFALNYDHLRLDWMDQRAQLATARVRLQLAEIELCRTDQLFKEKIVSEQALDAAQSLKEGLDAEVRERSTLVIEQEAKLKQLSISENSPSYPKETSPEDVLRASIQVQEQKLRLTEAELSPVKLVVPMDGTISAILHRSGEAVSVSEPIVTIAGLSADRVVSFIRQPLVIEPVIGMKVEVRARSLDRGVTEAEIIQVGHQMQAIDPILLPPTTLHLHEQGLPILVSLPRQTKLLPGELVDLRLVPGKAPTPGP